jgi:hypothetical protein
MPSGEKTNFAARFEYLNALQQQWPELLADLHSGPFRLYRAYLEANPSSAALQTLARLTEALRQRASPELTPIDQALRQWGNAHGHIEAWIWDAALQTMDSWAHGGRVQEWQYFPEELVSPKFEVAFGYWIPPRQEWREFKQVTDELYRRRLAAYRAAVSKIWGHRQSKLGEHAKWTVQWQQGRSPEFIQRKYLQATHRTISLANIQQSVHEFAAAAHLALRKPKAGRGAKKNVSSTTLSGPYI